MVITVKFHGTVEKRGLPTERKMQDWKYHLWMYSGNIWSSAFRNYRGSFLKKILKSLEFFRKQVIWIPPWQSTLGKLSKNITAPTLKWHNIKSENSYSSVVKILRFVSTKIWNSDLSKLRWAPEERTELASVMLISIYHPIMKIMMDILFVLHFSRTEMKLII